MNRPHAVAVVAASVPLLVAPIPGRSTQISGSFTAHIAKQLAAELGG